MSDATAPLLLVSMNVVVVMVSEAAQRARMTSRMMDSRMMDSWPGAGMRGLLPGYRTAFLDRLFS